MAKLTERDRQDAYAEVRRLCTKVMDCEPDDYSNQSFLFGQLWAALHKAYATNSAIDGR